MRIGADRIRARKLIYVFLCFFLFSVATGSLAFAAEKTEPSAASQSKETFNLILPFKDLTVGQGQEVTMDAEVVNRTRDPVEVNLSLDGVPKGWDVNFNSRYPSYPIRSVTVAGAGAEASATKSTTIEFKAKVPEATRPGTYQIKVAAKDAGGSHAVRRDHQFSRDIEESRNRRIEAHEPISGAQHGVGSNAEVHGGSEKRDTEAFDRFFGGAAPPGLDRAFQAAVR